MAYGARALWSRRCHRSRRSDARPGGAGKPRTGRRAPGGRQEGREVGEMPSADLRDGAPTGKPCAVQAARTVRGGADGKGPASVPRRPPTPLTPSVPGAWHVGARNARRSCWMEYTASTGGAMRRCFVNSRPSVPTEQRQRSRSTVLSGRAPTPEYMVSASRVHREYIALARMGVPEAIATIGRLGSIGNTWEMMAGARPACAGCGRGSVAWRHAAIR